MRRNRWPDVIGMGGRMIRNTHFKNNYNPKIWYRYRDQEQVLIQVYGYDTLVETAKKRNQAFCTILLDE